MVYKISRQTKLKSKESGTIWYVYNILIDEYDETIVTIGRYGNKYGGSLENSTVKYIRDNYIFWE